MTWAIESHEIEQCQLFVYYKDTNGRRGSSNLPATAAYLLPVENDVQDTLKIMLLDTRTALEEKSDDTIATYEFAHSYPSSCHLTRSLNADGMNKIQEINNTLNAEVNLEILNKAENITYYFVVYTSADGQKRSVGVKVARSFKQVARAKRFMQFQDNHFSMISGSVFLLDPVFDFLIEQDTTHILHPNAFESIAELNEHIKQHCVSKAQTLETTITAVDFSSVIQILQSGSSAMRLAKQVMCLSEGTNFSVYDRVSIVTRAQEHRVQIDDSDPNKIKPTVGKELDFLKFLNGRFNNHAFTGIPHESLSMRPRII